MDDMNHTPLSVREGGLKKKIAWWWRMVTHPEIKGEGWLVIHRQALALGVFATASVGTMFGFFIAAILFVVLT